MTRLSYAAPLIVVIDTAYDTALSCRLLSCTGFAVPLYGEVGPRTPRKSIASMMSRSPAGWHRCCYQVTFVREAGHNSPIADGELQTEDAAVTDAAKAKPTLDLGFLSAEAEVGKCCGLVRRDAGTWKLDKISKPGSGTAPRDMDDDC